uniref:Uncharacterized protein n=1 Tax=Timema monikensis TaxID=170555 RepID=A0A7R9HR96_9NEOP|nr:unnamed protein product [Timema monikensis]
MNSVLQLETVRDAPQPAPKTGSHHRGVVNFVMVFPFTSGACKEDVTDLTDTIVQLLLNRLQNHYFAWGNRGEGGGITRQITCDVILVGASSYRGYGLYYFKMCACVNMEEETKPDNSMRLTLAIHAIFHSNSIEWKRRDACEKHIKSKGHIKQVQASLTTGVKRQLSIEGAIQAQKKAKDDRVEFIMDTTEMFLKANIPIEKLDNPAVRSWMGKYIKGSGDLPSASWLRREYVPKCGALAKKHIKDSLANKSVAIFCDETTDRSGNCVTDSIHHAPLAAERPASSSKDQSSDLVLWDVVCSLLSSRAVISDEPHHLHTTRATRGTYEALHQGGQRFDSITRLLLSRQRRTYEIQMSRRHRNKQPAVDLVVALVVVPILIVFGIMLETNMRGDWTQDAESSICADSVLPRKANKLALANAMWAKMEKYQIAVAETSLSDTLYVLDGGAVLLRLSRWNVLGLGLALLCVSLLMCCYVTHRLGLCIWEAHNRERQGDTQQSAQDGMTSVSSQLQLVVSGDLPPSYDSIVACDHPPPYYTVLMVCEGKNGVRGGAPLSEQPKKMLRHGSLPLFRQARPELSPSRRYYDLPAVHRTTPNQATG